jgi:transcription initiation factor TFIIE beta subunit-like protein
MSELKKAHLGALQRADASKKQLDEERKRKSAKKGDAPKVSFTARSRLRKTQEKTLSSLLHRIVTFLRKVSKPVNAEDILNETDIDIFKYRDLIAGLDKNPKIFHDHVLGTFTFQVWWLA